MYIYDIEMFNMKELLFVTSKLDLQVSEATGTRCTLTVVELFSKRDQQI